jgi:hypothetical protein
MSGYRGFSSKQDYEKHYSGPLPQWEMDAMEAYAKEAEEERMARLIDIAAELRHETDGAYLLFDGRTQKHKDGRVQDISVWVPKSQVEKNEDGTFTMPEWLALEKGFI